MNTQEIFRDLAAKLPVIDRTVFQRLTDELQLELVKEQAARKRAEFAAKAAEAKRA